MLSVADAYRRILATARPLPPETVPLAAAVGRVLAQAVVADRDFPPYDRVTMDGIALNYNALDAGQTQFRIERTQLAGDAPQPLADPRAAIEIMTGAALPPGTDTIVRYEDLEFTAENAPARQATVRGLPPRPGHNVHRRGSDQPAGARLLAPGLVLSPADVAVAATVGAATLAVARRPRLAVVSTGDEIVPIGATPLPHQIRSSNAAMLQAALALDGIESEAFHFNDDLDSLKVNLVPLLTGFDAVLLSGGVSKGKADFLPQALRESGGGGAVSPGGAAAGAAAVVWGAAGRGGGVCAARQPGGHLRGLLPLRARMAAAEPGCGGAPAAVRGAGRAV